MLRTVKLPHGWDEYRHKLHLTQGGTGETTAPSALAALNGVPREGLGLPGGVLPLREDSTIDPKYFGTLALSEITIDGDNQINGGETKQYNITNFDSFTPYHILPLNGRVVREGPIIFYTADNVRAQGGFTINGKFYPIQISDAGPETPRIVTPLNGEIDKDLAILMTLSPYRVVGNSLASWRSTQWQVSKDPSFQTPTIDQETGEDNKNIYLAQNLESDTLYYFRARYHSNNSSEAEWSEVVSVRTRKVYTAPVIISPVIGRDPISDFLNFETTPFTPSTLTVTVPTIISGVDAGHLQAKYTTKHDSTEWEISDNILFRDPRKGKIEGAVITGMIDGLTPDKTYYLRVRHNHRGDRPIRSHSNGRMDTEVRIDTGTWSKPIVFTTLTFFGAPAPKILTPENGEGSLGPTVTVTTSKYHSPTGDVHTSTDWQIAKDPAFTKIYRQSEEDKENMTRFVLQSMPTSTTYYVRVRFNSKRHGKGQWSTTHNFTTKAFYGSDTPGGGLTKPSIYKPSEGEEIGKQPFEIVSSPFAPDEAGPHFSTDWQISRQSNFNTIDRQLIASVASKTVWTVDHLTAGTTYFVRVRHNSRDYGSSQWSEPHRFRMAGSNQGGSDGTGPRDPDDRTVEISSIVPTKPRVQMPANNSTNIDENITVTLDDYRPVVINARVPIVINNYSNTKMEVSYSSIHNGTDWELSTIESFPEGAETTKGAINDGGMQFQINSLNANTTYYLRVRHNHDFKAITEVNKEGIFKFVDKHEVGLWSDVVIFHTGKNFGPEQPTIVSHTEGQTIDGREETFQVSPYVEKEGMTYRNTEWEISENDTFKGSGVRRMQTDDRATTQINLTDIVYNRTYYIRVRHNSTTHNGLWSKTLSVQSERLVLEDPVILTPSEGGEVRGPDATVTAKPLTDYIAGVKVKAWEAYNITDNQAVESSSLQFSIDTPILTVKNVSGKQIRVRVKYALGQEAESNWSAWVTFNVTASQAPNKAVIATPANNTQTNETGIRLECAPYSHPENVPYKETRWEYSEHPNFEENVSRETRQTTTLDISSMMYKDYYFRAKHIDQNNKESEWSDVIKISFVEPVPAKPSMIQPSNGDVVSADAFNLQSSAYSTEGSSSLSLVEYEITNLETGDVSTHQHASENPTEVNAEMTATYRVRARHQSQSNKHSEWSDPVEFALVKPVADLDRNVRKPIAGVFTFNEGGRLPVENETIKVPNTPYADEIAKVIYELSVNKDFSTLGKTTIESQKTPEGLLTATLDYQNQHPLYVRVRTISEENKSSRWSPVSRLYRPNRDEIKIVLPEDGQVVAKGDVYLKALSGFDHTATEYEVVWDVQDAETREAITVHDTLLKDNTITGRLQNVDGKRIIANVKLKNKASGSFSTPSYNVTFSVTQDASSYPEKPTILTPSQKGNTMAVMETLDVRVLSSTYQSRSSAEHASTDWQFALDPDFKEVIHFAYKDTNDKLSVEYRVPKADSYYYVRVRYRDVNGKTSLWSEPVGFYGATTTPETPRVTGPENEATGTSIGMVKATAFSNGLSEPLEYEVEVKNDTTGEKVLSRSGMLSSGVTDLVEINDVIDDEVRIRVRYKNTLGFYSRWSIPVSYTAQVDDSLRGAQPTITNPTANQYLRKELTNFTSSNYVPKSTESHVKTYWQVVRNTDTPGVLLSKHSSNTNLYLWSIGPNEYEGEGKLYVRVRYQADNGIHTPWSEYVPFHGPLSKPIKPSIITPVPGTVTDYTVEFTASEYIFPDSEFQYAKWKIVDSDTEMTLVESQTNSTTFRTNELNGKNVTVTVYYVSQSGVQSEPSEPLNISVRATPLSPAEIVKPTHQGKIYTEDSEMRVTIPVSDYTNVFWEVSTFPDFPNFVQQADTQANPYLVLQSEPGTRYVRVRYRNSEGRMSDWSNVVEFLVVEGENPDLTLLTPSVIAPTQNQTFTVRSATLTSSEFNKEGDTLTEAEWEVRDVFTGQLMDHQDNKTLNFSMQFPVDSMYKARVRHKSAKGLISKWSAWREFVVFQKSTRDNGDYDKDIDSINFPTKMLEGQPTTIKPAFSLTYGADLISKRTVQIAKDPHFNEVLFEDHDKQSYSWTVPTIAALGGGEPVLYLREVLEFKDGRTPHRLKPQKVVVANPSDPVLRNDPGLAVKILSPSEGGVVKDNPVWINFANKKGHGVYGEFEVRSALDDELIVKSEPIAYHFNVDTSTTFFLTNQAGKSLKVRARESNYGVEEQWTEWVHFNVASEAAMKPIAPQISDPNYFNDNSDRTKFKVEAYSHPNGVAHADTHWQFSLTEDFSELHAWKFANPDEKLEGQTDFPFYDGWIYARARFRDANGAFSDWSRTVLMTAPSARPEQPSITQPLESTVMGRSLTLQGSPFVAVEGTLRQAIWTLTYTLGNESGERTVTKTTTTPEVTFENLVPDTRIEVKVRYVSSIGRVSHESEGREFSIHSDPRDIPGKPRIIMPENQSLLQAGPITFRSSPYQAPENASEHNLSQWRVELVSNTNQYEDSGISGTSLTEWTGTFMNRGQALQAKVRHISANGVSSEWSDYVEFHIANKPTPASIAQPATGAVNVSTDGNLTIDTQGRPVARIKVIQYSDEAATSVIGEIEKDV